MNAVELREIENFDSRPVKMGDESRFLCCLSAQCRAKPKDAAHRSLCVNTRTGFYVCHRCAAKGKLKDFWEERPQMNKRQMSRLKLAAQFSAPPQREKTAAEMPTEHLSENYAEKFKSYLAAFAGSAAENYLEARGINREIARTAECGYAANWEHWEKREGKWLLAGVDKRVVFPIRDAAGELVAIHGRAIDENHHNSPKITKGDKSLGIFATPPEALRSKVVAICEGQTDALALQTCGLSAVAMTGTSAPAWLLKKLSFRAVLIATDADEAGDKAALKLKNELEIRGCKTFRLRPRRAKDWAEVLQRIGADKLKEFLAPFAADATDAARTDLAWQLFRENRETAAEFLTNLIENGEVREYLRERFRIAQAA